MAIQWISGDTFTCVSGDTKPTLVPTDTKAIETNTDDIYRFNGTSWVLYIANDKTETLTNKTIDSDVNTLKLPLCSVLVYKTGTTYKAKDMENGTTLATTSTTDASVVINAAIAGIPGAAARGWGGRVFIHAGDYECKTKINLDAPTLGFHGVEIEGEGRGATNIKISPSSALTDGLKIGMARTRLSNMRIYGNANVTNVIKVEPGPTLSPQVSRMDYNIFENLLIDGAPSTQLDYGESLGLPTAGQKGIYVDSTNMAPFFYKLDNIDFRGLEIGEHFYNGYATSSMQKGINSQTCDIGIKLSGGQHNISTCWFQGDATYGRFGIYVDNIGGGGNSGSVSKFTNINVELFKTATESAAVYMAGGVANVECVAVHNGYADDKYWFHTLDRSGGNWQGNIDYREHPRRLHQSKIRTGQWSPGLNRIGLEEGILQGNMVAFSSPAGTFASIPTVNGPTATMQTANAANAIIGYYYSNTGATGGASIWGPANIPRLRVRMYPFYHTTLRAFIGFWNVFAAPTSAADILNGRGGIGAWIDTAVSTNWRVMHNDGSGASTVATLGAGSAIQTGDLFSVDVQGGTAFQTVTFGEPGSAYFRNIVETNIQTTGTWGILIYLETLDTLKQWWPYDISLEIR